MKNQLLKEAKILEAKLANIKKQIAKEETLRMQMLAGIITESQYKKRLNEIKVNTPNLMKFFQKFLSEQLIILEETLEYEYDEEVKDSINFVESFRTKPVSSLNQLAEYLIEIEDELTEKAGAYEGEFYGELRLKLIDLIKETNFSQGKELISILDKHYEEEYDEDEL